jgi:hypothetical protein
LALLEPYRGTLGCFEAYWAFSDHSRLFQSVYKPVLTILVCFGVFVAVLGHSKFFQSVLGCFRAFEVFGSFSGRFGKI